MFEFFNLGEVPALPWKKKVASSLSDTVIKFETKHSKTEKFTYQDCFRGIQVFGTTGSGKTSGSGQKIALSYLKAGFGGLVLAVKSDEAETWINYAKASGREKDLIIVSPESGLSFNFLKESGEIKAQQVMNITQLIMDVYALYSRDGSKSGQDSFWQDQLQSCLSHCITLASAQAAGVSVQTIIQLFDLAIEHADQFALNLASKKTSKLEILCGELKKSRLEIPGLHLASEYFLGSFKNLPEKTRSIIIAMMKSIFEPLEHFPLNLLFGDKTEVSPASILSGKIVVIDVSIHEYRKAGLLCQLIWKSAFMNAVTRRKNVDTAVFLWADESQYFVEERDIQFLTTARSKKCAVVYLTQNVSNYESALGNESKVAAILGSLNTKIFHQNNDPKTNQLASKSIGKIKKTNVSYSGKPGILGILSGSERTKTISKTLQDEVCERDLIALRSGGKQSNYLVEAVIHSPGHSTSDKGNWFFAKFDQRQ